MTDVSKNFIEVNVMDKLYRVTCPIGCEKELTDAVAYLNCKLELAARQGLPYNRDHLAIITALNLSYELLKLRSQMADEAIKADRLIERIKASSSHFNQLETTSGMSL